MTRASRASWTPTSASASVTGIGSVSYLGRPDSGSLLVEPRLDRVAHRRGLRRGCGPDGAASCGRIRRGSVVCVEQLGRVLLERGDRLCDALDGAGLAHLEVREVRSRHEDGNELLVGEAGAPECPADLRFTEAGLPVGVALPGRLA